MCPRQITIKMRGIASCITSDIAYLNRLADSTGAPITLISPEMIIAARTCPTAAHQLQCDRAARAIKIYQTALTVAHQLAQQITEVEDLSGAK